MSGPIAAFDNSGNLTCDINGTASGNLVNVATATAGALTGNGTTGSKLAVNVDGSSVTINGSNQLAATLPATSVIVASADLTAQTAAVSSITTFTGAGTYRIGVYVTINSIVTDVLQIKVSYTDENGNAQTQTFSAIGGGINLSATGAFVFATMDIRCYAAIPQAITVLTALTVGAGTINYDVGATIEKLR